MEGSNTEPLKIFVGGLSWETTQDSLKEYFEEFGEVSDAVIMSEPGSRKPRGFGFVTFVSKEAMDKALSPGDHYLNGKKIDPKPATKKNSGISDCLVTKVFVGGLPAGTTEDHVSDYFKQFGTITELDLKYDKQTGRMRGFGFVGFDSARSVNDLLLQGQYHRINGKQVEVKRAEPRGGALKTEMSGHRKPQHYPQTYGGNAGFYNYYGSSQPPQSYGQYSGYGHQVSDHSYGHSGQHGQQQSSQTSYGSFQPSSHSNPGYNAATPDSSYSSHSYGSNSYTASGTYNYPEEGSAYTSRTTNYTSHNQHGY